MKKVKKNINQTDRLVRMILGLIFIVLMYLGSNDFFLETLNSILGCYLIGTSIASFCPLYSFLRIKSVKEKNNFY